MEQWTSRLPCMLVHYSHITFSRPRARTTRAKSEASERASSKQTMGLQTFRETRTLTYGQKREERGSTSSASLRGRDNYSCHSLTVASFFAPRSILQTEIPIYYLHMQMAHTSICHSAIFSTDDAVRCRSMSMQYANTNLLTLGYGRPCS